MSIGKSTHGRMQATSYEAVGFVYITQDTLWVWDAEPNGSYEAYDTDTPEALRLIDSCLKAERSRVAELEEMRSYILEQQPKTQEGR